MVRIEEAPATIELGLAEILTVGAVAATKVTVAEDWVVCPELLDAVAV